MGRLTGGCDTALMADNNSAVVEASETVDVTLHGAAYSVTISTLSGDTLSIEVEQKNDASCWRGDFTSRYIEDITSKTGNYKRFPVFIKMLLSALKQASDSVFVDLLTYQDLELLKARKAAANGTQHAQQPPKTLVPNIKRYLILTYAAEFDRVHYPLPLLYDENPDPQRLKTIIASLRAELANVQLSDKGSLGYKRGQQQTDSSAEVLRLREENNALRQELHARSSNPSSEARELAKELRSVRKDRDLLQARCEALEAELERERGVHRREMRRKVKENQEVYDELARSRDAVRDLKNQVRQLTAELDRARPLSASDRLRAAYGGGRNSDNGRKPSRGNSPGGWAAPPLYGGNSSSRQHDSRTRGTSSRERNASPSSSRPNSAPAARSPGGGRFDPTEYIRQQRERLERRTSGSANSSRAPTPPRSQKGSGRASPSYSRPASGTHRDRSQSPAAGRGAANLAAGSRHGTQSPAGSQRSSGSSRAAGGGAGSGWSKFPNISSQPPAGTTATAGGRAGSRPQSAERATSPGRALQEVKKKLSEFVTKRSTDGLSAASSAVGIGLPVAGPPSVSSAGLPAATGLPSRPSKSQLFNDASADIADIDNRLHALQNFLKMAKASAANAALT